MRTKTAITALAALILAAGCAGAGEMGPPGNQSDKKGGPQGTEAFRACEGKARGTATQLITPSGEIVSGTCEEQDGKLVLRPARQRESRKQSSGKRPKPPPEAYKACEGKAAGATASLVSPRGETISGTCADDGGRLVLRPELPPRDSR